MKTENAYVVNDVVTVRVTEHGPKLANIRVTLIQSGFGEEGVFYPAQDVTIYGEGIAKLRTILNELSPE